jgi:ABC-2 type transport system permease protein
MTLWRLEWLRLVRTRRLLVILSVYAFFGLVGPLTARYVSQILSRLGTGGVHMEFPTPRPADGIAQFVSNASQIGLLVVVMVAGSALAFDSRTEMAIFLRTRVARVREIIIPAYAMSTLAAIAGLIVGSVAAWYETAVLLGAPPAGRMALGMVAGALFLAFAVALTALVAGLLRSTVATIGVTLGVLLGLATVGQFGALGRWLPTRLAGAMAELVAGSDPVDYLPAAIVAVLATVACLGVATALAARREL